MTTGLDAARSDAAAGDFSAALCHLKAYLGSRSGALTLAQVKTCEQVLTGCFGAGLAHEAQGLSVQLFGQGARDPRLILQAFSEFLDADNLPQTHRFWPYVIRMEEPEALVEAARFYFCQDDGESARASIRRAIDMAPSSAHLALRIATAIEAAGDASLLLEVLPHWKQALPPSEFAVVQLCVARFLPPQDVELIDPAAAAQSGSSPRDVWLRFMDDAPKPAQQDGSSSCDALISRHANDASTSIASAAIAMPADDTPRSPLLADGARSMTVDELLARARVLPSNDPRSPLVSVLMPIRNGDRFFTEAVGSVFDQTYSEWEILFVDDGCSDNSGENARALARANPGRIACLEHPGRANRGLPASRNLALARARGRYIAMLDIDDLWLPEKLARQVSVLERFPEVAMVYGPIVYWYGWTGRKLDLLRDFVSPHGRRHDLVIQPPEQLRHLVIYKDGLPTPSGALVRHSTLREANIRFDERFEMYEDEVFLSQIALRFPVYLMSESFDRYRQHDDSFTAQAMRKGEYSPQRPNRARGNFLRWLEGHVADSGLDKDGTLLAEIRLQLEPYSSE